MPLLLQPTALCLQLPLLGTCRLRLPHRSSPRVLGRLQRREGLCARFLGSTQRSRLGLRHSCELACLPARRLDGHLEMCIRPPELGNLIFEIGTHGRRHVLADAQQLICVGEVVAQLRDHGLELLQLMPRRLRQDTVSKTNRKCAGGLCQPLCPCRRDTRASASVTCRRRRACVGGGRGCLPWMPPPPEPRAHATRGLPPTGEAGRSPHLQLAAQGRMHMHMHMHMAGCTCTCHLQLAGGPVSLCGRLAEPRLLLERTAQLVLCRRRRGLRLHRELLARVPLRVSLCPCLVKLPPTTRRRNWQGAAHSGEGMCWRVFERGDMGCARRRCRAVQAGAVAGAVDDRSGAQRGGQWSGGHSWVGGHPWSDTSYLMLPASSYRLVHYEPITMSRND